jgi:hypothetical protein
MARNRLDPSEGSVTAANNLTIIRIVVAEKFAKF